MNDIGDCETDMAMGKRRERKTLSFDRKKQLCYKAILLADQLVAEGVEPHEVQFLLGNISELLVRER